MVGKRPLLAPLLKTHYWCVVVGPTLGQLYFNCWNLSLGPLLCQCQHANNDVLPTTPTITQRLIAIWACPFASYQKKSRNLVFFFCLKIGKKEILYRFLYKLVLMPKTLTLKKLKVHVVKIFILYNLCSIILFEIFVVCIEGQKFAVLSSEIPINVTHYQYTCMLCWDQKWEIFSSMTTTTKY